MSKTPWVSLTDIASSRSVTHSWSCLRVANACRITPRKAGYRRQLTRGVFGVMHRTGPRQAPPVGR